MIISDIWEQAAARWRERTVQREKQRTGAAEDSRSRLRLRRLTQSATQEKARALSLAADRRSGRRTFEALEDFAQERILGKSDLVDANFLELAVAMARSVCRIRLDDGFGTGFMVSPSLLLTNNHVLTGKQVAAEAVAEFDYQQNTSGELLPVQVFKLQPDKFFFTSEPLDFSLVSVAPRSALRAELGVYGWVKLIAEQGKADAGDCVNIVQHPRGGLKQIALRENEVVDIFDDFLHYLTDTEPGSSGSPCFNDQWELIALHHSGVPKTDTAGRLLRDDGQVWRRGVDAPGRVAWVANEGVRVSSIVKRLQKAEMNAAGERLIDELVSATPPNPIELARDAKHPGAKPATVPAGNGHTWTIPIQVTIAVGEAAPLQATMISVEPTALAMAAGAAGGGVAIVQPEEAVRIDPDYSNRAGYDEDFIPSFRVPLPELSAAMKVSAAVNPQPSRPARKNIFDYEHFSVVMNKRRRLAYYTAVNIDGARKQPMKRQQDSWSFDPRLDDTLQVGGEVYVGNALDQGHLVRRLDPAWGTTVAAARKANDDTFHYTNCAPQHKTFNRGGELWQGLENYLLDKAQKTSKRLTVFTGPVFRSNDPAFQNDAMSKPVRIPLDYWKVAAMVKEDGAKIAAAFVVTQSDLIGDGTDLEERFQPSLFQVPIKDVERLTGLKFGSLRDFDTIGDSGGLERFETLDAAVRPVGALADIRL